MPSLVRFLTDIRARLFTTAGALVLSACATSATAIASPPSSPVVKADPSGPSGAQSQLLDRSGLAIVGKSFPFFSGWALTDTGSQPLNLGRVLKRKRRGYVVTVAASWCAPCRKGLKRITEARDRFKKANIDVIVIVADSSAHAKSLREEFKLNWTSVIVDEFKTYSSKMCPDPKDTKSLSLPRSFVLDSTGQVKRIISEEADDYIDQLLGAL